MSKHDTDLSKGSLRSLSVSKDVERSHLIRQPPIKSPSTPPNSAHRKIKEASTSTLARYNDNNRTSDSEPATDHETQFGKENDHGEIVTVSAEDQAVAMLHEITERTNDSHQTFIALRKNILREHERINELQTTFKDLVRQTVGLQELCNGEVDTDKLEKLFQTIQSEEENRQKKDQKALAKSHLVEQHQVYSSI